jgi:hypothetical protein
MELEALLLGLEPFTALAVGVSALILAPVISSVGSALGEKDSNSNLIESLTDSTKELTKKGLVWSFEAFENAQTIFSEAEESFRDLLADAKTEHLLKKNQAESENTKPHQIEIVDANAHS